MRRKQEKQAHALTRTSKIKAGSMVLWLLAFAGVLDKVSGEARPLDL
jgi:hypothetical protein